MNMVLRRSPNDWLPPGILRLFKAVVLQVGTTNKVGFPVQGEERVEAAKETVREGLATAQTKAEEGYQARKGRLWLAWPDLLYKSSQAL